MKKNVYLGSFNAEAYYSDSQYYKLPSFSVKKGINPLFNSMDELMIPMLDENDILITRYDMDEVYKDYYESNFIRFTTYSCLSIEQDIYEDKSIFSVIKEVKPSNVLDCLADVNNQIIEYSLIKDCYDLYDLLGLKNNKPNEDIVRMVNSKAYSNELKYKLDLPYKGVLVKSIDEFVKVSKEMLTKYSSILIKDVMGVSGQGILIVQNEFMIMRLEKIFDKQQCEKFSFLLEPYWDKIRDFSCQFTIEQDGNVNIQGYQENNNRKFTYLGSSYLSSDLINKWNPNYTAVIGNVAKLMFEDGYYGPVCVDSMLLNDNTVSPLVEINARLSMGRFNLMTNNRLLKHGAKSNLIFLQVTKNKNITVAELLQKLDDNHILCKKDTYYGVIPLAPNTWRFITTDEPHRMYFQLVYEVDKNQSTVNHLRERLICCLEQIDIHVLQ